MKVGKIYLALSILVLFNYANAQEIVNTENSVSKKMILLFSGTSQSRFGNTIVVKINKNAYYISGRFGKFSRNETNKVYDNHSYNKRYSFTSGYSRELNKFIDVFGGLGYGYYGYQYLVDDFDSNDWIMFINDYGNDSKTFYTINKGLESEIGFIFHYKFLYTCIGLSSLNLRNYTPVLGIGYGFKF